MKIGILTSSLDMFALFQFAHRYNHEYVIWYDDASVFWGDSNLDLVLPRIKTGIDFLQKKGVDVVLVAPVLELFLTSNASSYKSPLPILPLFSTYFLSQCLSHSLVGKIGFAGDWLDMAIGQDLLQKLASTYVLSDHQIGTKKFHFSFAWRGKNVRLWRILLETLSWSNPLVNTLIKNDLKYFKNAAVDTFIPMNYSYFLVQKTIQHLLNFKKTRFHGIDTLESVFDKIVDSKTSEYSVSVFYTDHGNFLTSNKRLLWLLDKGKSSKLSVEKA